MSDPGTVEARGCARGEDQPGAAGRKPAEGVRWPQAAGAGRRGWV